MFDYPEVHNIDDEFSSWAIGNNLFMVPFPHNTSTVLDPLDVKVFGAFKVKRQKILDLLAQ